MKNHELNAWLAEHVMGWEPIPSKFDPPHYIMFRKADGKTVFLPGGAVKIGPRWSPSSNPAQALEVAEHLPDFNLYRVGKEWFVQIKLGPEQGPHPTPALALSLAVQAWREAQS